VSVEPTNEGGLAAVDDASPTAAFPVDRIAMNATTDAPTITTA
jgi:hypothetical protein